MTKLPTPAAVAEMTMAELVATYNAISDQPVKRFASRQAGIDRVLAAIAAYRAAQRTPTVASQCRELVLAGKSNAEIWAIVQPEFDMPDSKKHYPSWYRNELKRKGLI